jgi:hypothetical protein
LAKGNGRKMAERASSFTKRCPVCAHALILRRPGR